MADSPGSLAGALAARLVRGSLPLPPSPLARSLGAALALSMGLLGCQPMPPSGSPFEPVPVGAPAAPPRGPAPDGPASAPAPGTGGGFDFEAEDRAPDGGEGEEDPVALQARLLGVDPSLVKKPAPAAPPVAVPAPAPAAVTEWDPSLPLPDASFGIKVLATLHDVQPPRVVLGLPDGSEQVVRAGAMLPAQGIVVLAVGRDVVQLARVVPDGFSARVEPLTVQALFPSGRPSAP